MYNDYMALIPRLLTLNPLLGVPQYHQWEELDLGGLESFADEEKGIVLPSYVTDEGHFGKIITIPSDITEMANRTLTHCV